MKIRYMGKLVRDDAGKFAKRQKRKSTFKKFCLLGLTGYAIFLAGGMFQPQVTAVETIVEVDNLAPKIEELKDKLVEDIRKCESRDFKESDGIIIFDSNDEASIGNFQFQRKTIQHYMKSLYGKTVTPKEAILIALDEQKARELTKDIIFKDSKGWKNWFNCGNKIDAQGRLQVIKELQ